MNVVFRVIGGCANGVWYRGGVAGGTERVGVVLGLFVPQHQDQQGAISISIMIRIRGCGQAESQDEREKRRSM